jgi:hypothetical protein
MKNANASIHDFDGTQPVALLCRVSYDSSLKINGYTPIEEWDGNQDWLRQEIATEYYDAKRHLFGENAMPQYAAITVELPKWMPVSYYIAHQVEIERFFHYGLPRNCCENVFASLESIGHLDCIYLCCDLLSKEYKPAAGVYYANNFRISLREQLVKWLDVLRHVRKFERPFTQKQVDAALKSKNMEEIHGGYDCRKPTKFKRIG